MECFECRTGNGRAVSAVAVCCDCGAGLCADHVRFAPREVHHESGLGRTTGRLPARTALCPVCDRAEHST
ncbi:DUF2180 family protein [Streptomyces sp. CC208A]|uniref:DUF2180 family protein n=1 Tax=Streptomyces sp. CC208A TaxID=3044573 RepID=UPI0024A97FDF|nr:DUF2180 family protein [Streptomyces sp. CC208A]